MSSTITKDHIVTLDYRVTDLRGEVVDQGEQPLVYLHGGYDGIFAVLEEELEGKAKGAALKITLQPEDAFGDYDAELLRVEDRALFPEDVVVGRMFERMTENGDDTMLFMVTDIAEDKVVVDGNHPLAGVALVFSCLVSDIRPATAQELEIGGPISADEVVAANDA